MKKLPVVLGSSLTVVFLLTAFPARSVPVETNAPTTKGYAAAVSGLPVDTVKYEWRDAQRQRTVPVKIYFPKTGSGPFPVVIFSHGLGGNRDGYEYLGRYWAQHGYVSVHLQHHGSDSELWQEVPPTEIPKIMQEAVANPQNAINRPLDVRFAIDQLTALNQAPGALEKRLDLDRIGVSGHSFGSFTTMAIAGEAFVTPAGRETSFADPRVKAAVAMSSSVPRDEARWNSAYANIRIPVFHMTGTKDDSPMGETKAAQRRVPFDRSHGPDQYLVTFQDGDHMIFSSRQKFQPGGEKDARFHDLIAQSATAFWDAYLKQDSNAKTWLADGGFAALLQMDGKFEQKLR